MIIAIDQISDLAAQGIRVRDAAGASALSIRHLLWTSQKQATRGKNIFSLLGDICNRISKKAESGCLTLRRSSGLNSLSARSKETPGKGEILLCAGS